MFYINKDTELTPLLLNKMMNKFNINVLPYLSKNKKYYDGVQDILNKQYSDETKPCNRVVTNFCKNITDSYCGYLASAGCISYQSEDDIDDIMEILRYNDYQDEDSDFLLNALIYGTAAELMYIDEEAKTRFRLINSEQCFGVYDDSLSNDLLYFVRWYKANEWDDSDKYLVDVYSNYDIKHFEMYGLNGNVTFLSEEPHYFNQCPANILNLPNEKSIFDCVLSKQDSYNTVFNASLDEMQEFVDAYLILNGVDADSDDIAQMKEDRVLVLPQDASAQWLIKTDNTTGVDARLKRIQEDIYRIASCPDFSSESFTGGVSSGVAIRYKLCGMENRAAKIASIMKKALQRRIEIICGIASLSIGEEIFRDIRIDMKRNVPVDNNEVFAIVNNLKGTVSDVTLLSQIPFVEDVNAEVELVKEQKQENMSLYSFNTEEE